MRQHFATGAELREIAYGLQQAVEHKPVTVHGVEYPDEKGIMFEDGAPISIVGTGYHIVQNQEMLLQAAAALDECRIQVDGVVEEDDLGYLRCNIRFKNPEYQLEMLTGETDKRDLLYLGIELSNSYGKPHVSRRVRGAGFHDEARMTFQRTLGYLSKNHTSKEPVNIKPYIRTLLERAPKLAKRIRDAEDTVLDREELHYVLLGLGYSDRAARKIRAAGRLLCRSWNPDHLTVWALYQALATHVERNGSIGGRMQATHDLERLIVPGATSRLIEQGRAIEAKRDLEKEAGPTLDAFQ